MGRSAQCLTWRAGLQARHAGLPSARHAAFDDHAPPAWMRRRAIAPASRRTRRPALGAAHARPSGRRERRGDVARMRDRRMRRAALRRDSVAQRRAARRAGASAVAPAKSRARAAALLGAQAHLPRRRRSSPRRQEHVGRTRAGQRGHGVEVGLRRSTQSVLPVGASSARRRARSSSVTAGRANRPAMPWPISAGVFGIARTTRSLPVARDDRVAADAGHHAELQRVADVRRARRARPRKPAA